MRKSKNTRQYAPKKVDKKPRSNEGKVKTDRKEYFKKRYLEKKEEILEKAKEYYRKNKKERIKYGNKRAKIRFHTEPLYKLNRCYRSRIACAFKSKGIKKTFTTEKLLGADIKTCRDHIEKQFVEGMTWENYGHKTWHIDHIIPLSSATNEEELTRLMHYTNLQPLWAEDNRKKGGATTGRPPRLAPE